jgi:hypothetical protein
MADTMTETATKPNLFTQLVAGELTRARRLHAPLGSAHEAYAVILEELEEFKTEVFKRTAMRSCEGMLTELVQTAAMCQRAAEDLNLLAD